MNAAAAKTWIYTCKTCKTSRRADYLAGQTAGIWVMASGGGKPTIYGGDVKNGLCACGRMMSGSPLKARVVEGVKCGALCRSSRGHVCDCSCGGANHGRG